MTAEITENTESLTIVQALNRVMRDVTKVEKKERNTQQNFSFRGIDATTKALAPALREHGVIVTPKVIESDYETVEIGKNKTPMSHVTVVVEYTFWGPSGDTIACTVLAEAMDSGDKACAKAMSVAFRIALLQTFALPTDEPDPDSESFERTSANTTNLARMRPADNQPVDWLKRISSTKDITELRRVWKEAGAAGALQDGLVTPNGEKVTVQDFLYTRSDELSVPKSA